VRERLFGDRLELLHVVLGIEAVLVERRLAHDGVEEVAALGHAAARLCRDVALRVDHDAARGLLRGPEVLGDEHLLAPRRPPGPPAFVREAEQCVAREDAVGVDAQRLLQVVLDQAEHLVGLVDLHRPSLEAVVLAQLRDDARVDAGDRCRAEVDRNAVGLAVAERRPDALAALHGASSPATRAGARRSGRSPCAGAAA
jgi:hypothetical protein